MKKVKMGQISPALKSLGVGGTLGSSLGIAAWYALPALSAHGLTIQMAATTGAAVMIAIHRTTLTVAPTARYYSLMVALLFDVQVGWMTAREARQIRSQLQREYYLGTLEQCGAPVPITARAANNRGADSTASPNTGASASFHAEGPH